MEIINMIEGSSVAAKKQIPCLRPDIFRSTAGTVLAAFLFLLVTGTVGWCTNSEADSGCMMADSGSVIEEIKAGVSAGISSQRLKSDSGKSTVIAPEADPDGFGETYDPAEIRELINRPEAQKLINGQELVWNEELPFIEDTPIRYYLDETILVIVWNEPASKCWGTFAEVFITEGSQLGRKLVYDKYGEQGTYFATTLSKQVNAVLATGGDFYNHPQRKVGIGVYEGKVCRFSPDSCDTCFITENGDFIFSFHGEFASKDEAQAFVDGNKISFSLCFGPVLLEDGVDKTPDYYRWGEINDRYARAAISQMGEHHYLNVTMNCHKPGYWYLATLRDATSVLIEHGCTNAYAIDGGQTASIILNHELINPVQFYREQYVTDIIYFSTAVADTAEG